MVQGCSGVSGWSTIYILIRQAQDGSGLLWSIGLEYHLLSDTSGTRWFKVTLECWAGGPFTF